MRATLHNSRGHKHSTTGYSAKHNDRQFDVEKADNINIDKVAGNIYWNICDGVYLDKDKADKHSFDDAEQLYYSRYFTHQWQDQQEKHKANRQYKRMKSFDEWRNSKRYCPAESYIQIGNVDDHADKKQMLAVGKDYIKALREFSESHGECFKILDYAYHFDEAVPQLHIRGVWQSADENGMPVIGQERALEKAGFDLPKPDKEEGQYNNRKMTFDKIMREKYLDICEEHGLDIVREPDPDASHNRSKKKYISDKKRELQEEIAELEAKKEALSQAVMDGREQVLQTAAMIQADRDLKASRQTRYVQQADDLVSKSVKGGKHAGKHPPSDSDYEK